MLEKPAPTCPETSYSHSRRPELYPLFQPFSLRTIPNRDPTRGRPGSKPAGRSLSQARAATPDPPAPPRRVRKIVGRGMGSGRGLSVTPHLPRLFPSRVPARAGGQSPADAHGRPGCQQPPHGPQTSKRDRPLPHQLHRWDTASPGSEHRGGSKRSPRRAHGGAAGHGFRNGGRLPGLSLYGRCDHQS